MPLKTTIGQVLVNDVLPPELRDYDRELIGGELDDLLVEIGRKYPGRYKDVTHKLMQLGNETAFREGTTLSVEDLEPPEEVRQDVLKHVQAQEKRIRDDTQMSEKEKQEALSGLYEMAQKLIVDQTYQKALKSRNPLALQVLSKARGNPMQLAALLSTPAMFRDAKGNTIPVFVRHSYAEGLKPWEYFAATFGARQGVVSTKFATRDAGDLGKQMNMISEGLIVTEDDCGTTNGIPADIDEGDNHGALLARDMGPFKMGTPVTAKVAKELKDRGYKKLLIRSPVACQSREGLCKKCAGLRETGKLPELREAIGLQATSALAERIAQGALNVKHCLFESTECLMGDRSVKMVSQITPGDYVMGVDDEGNLRPVKVKEVFDNGRRMVWRTTFQPITQKRAEDLITVDSTLDHKILGVHSTERGKHPSIDKAEMFPVGTKSDSFHALVVMDAGNDVKSHDIERFARRLHRYMGDFRTFDIEVDHPSHRFVLANGLIVSNSGGQKEQAGERVYAGFDVINQLAQVPAAFRHSATVAEIDGEVTKIEPAPQGGTNIFVGDQVFYVDPEQAATVEVGDQVEAGDQLSTGILNPAEVVKYKGIGEGRRYFADRFAQAFKESKIKASRRNTEVLARALIDHVQVKDPEGLGDYLPGDVTSYSGLAYAYKPRDDSNVLAPKNAVGQYLEQPALQYTIGTRVTNKMLREFDDFGVDKVRVHTEPPAFEPQMQRLRTAGQFGNDWMAKLHGTYLKRNLLSDVQSGAESKIHGTHPVPGLAYGVEFGESQPGKVTY